MSVAELWPSGGVNNGDPRGSSPSGRVDWHVAHATLVRLARARAGLDWEEGRWLLMAQRERVHVQLGVGSFAEYVERLFGYGPRLVREKLRVAEALEGLPKLANQLQQGAVSWSAARELTRVAVPETEEDWLSVASGKTAHEVERLVSGHVPGDRPADEPDDRARRHVLRFEVTGEVLATFREAVTKLRRESGESLDDDAILLLMARQVLAGPTDEGRASYQVAMTVCPSCHRGCQQAGGEQVTVKAEVVEMASCDAQHLKDGHRATQAIPPARRREVLHRDGGRCVFPGCRQCVYVDVHHLDSKAEGGGHQPDNLVTLCSAHHRAVHGGRVMIDGKPSTGLRFWHADGSEYGGRVVTIAIDARAQVFQALRELGFRESEARRALSEAAHVGHDAQALLRHCLRGLSEQLAKKAGCG